MENKGGGFIFVALGHWCGRSEAEEGEEEEEKEEEEADLRPLKLNMADLD